MIAKEKPWQRRVRQGKARAAVMQRAGGRCEGCGERKDYDLQWAHLLGRGHLLSKPFCDDPAVTVALCLQCHFDRLDNNRDPELRRKLHQAARPRIAAASWSPRFKVEAERVMTMMEEKRGL